MPIEQNKCDASSKRMRVALPSCTSRLPHEPDSRLLNFLTQFCSQACISSTCLASMASPKLLSLFFLRAKDYRWQRCGSQKRGVWDELQRRRPVPWRNHGHLHRCIPSGRESSRSRGDANKHTLRPPMSLWFRSWIGVRGEGKGKEKRSCSAIPSPRIAGT